MNCKPKIFRSVARSFSMMMLAAMFSIIGLLNSLSAQEYLGVLSEIMKPDNAVQLQLSEEQRDQVQKLIHSRIAAAVAFSQKLREAPIAEHDDMRAEFAAESESLAREILTPEQREQLSKISVSSRGLLSLHDDEIASALNLADWQAKEVATWYAKMRQDRQTENAEKTRVAAEQAIRGIISDSQWSAWQVLAGMISESNAGEPVPPPQPDAEANIVAISPSDSTLEPSVAPTELLAEEQAIDEIRLEMNFQGQPWGDVIRWLAEQADLSVQSGATPPGTFTYRDRSRQYSVTEALDIMNAALLDSGFTLFRQGRMLRSINFEKDQKMAGEVLKELADFVPVSLLSTRGDYEPIKTLFTLERLNPEEIKEEVSQLLSIQGSVVSLPSSGQLVVTDMAGHVRLIADYISRAEDPTSSRGASIQTFTLKYVNADEVLSVARPLIGLEDGVNKGTDISISTNAFGTVIYAKGQPDKIQNLRDLIRQMDIAPSEEDDSVAKFEPPYIDRHRVVGIDVKLAYEVISQLLAGSPDVRLASDETAKQLVLMARADEHKLVSETLRTLAGESSNFEVIQLERLDPQLAIAAIKKFFGLTDATTAEKKGPVIDGDLLARQVWVKGSQTEVEQIRALVEKLERNSKENSLLGDKIRVIPLTGRSATDTLEQVQSLWSQAYGSKNKIRVVAPNGGARGDKGLQQKTFAPQGKNPPSSTPAPTTSGQQPETTDNKKSESEPETGLRADSNWVRNNRGHFVLMPQTAESEANEDVSTEAESSAGAEIVIMEGPNGLIISSDDKEALDQFDSLMRMMADQAAMGSAEPTVVYLRNIKASAAKELLESILSGSASSSGSAGGGDLIGDMAGAMLGGLGGSMFGAMMGGGGDSTTSSSVGMASGTYSIIADPRLNALFVKATPADMALIEQFLQVIDQVESPFAIETRGQVALIPVVTQDVSEVLTTVKSIFGDRIQGNAPAAGGGNNQQPNPAEIINALRGAARGGRGGGNGGGGQAGNSSELTEPKISMGADVKTNTLVVMAQPQQIAEIRELVELLDQAGEEVEEDVAVIDFGGIKATVLQAGLTRILGPKAQANITTGSTSTTVPAAGGQPTNNAAADADAARRRAEFFQRMQQGGGMQGGGMQGGGMQGGGRNQGRNQGGMQGGQRAQGARGGRGG